MFLFYLYFIIQEDTLNYFLGSKSIVNLILYDFDKGYAVLMNTDSHYNSLSSFNVETGYPPTYMFSGDKTFNVCRLSFFLTLLGLKSFLLTSILTACFSYVGIWKIYKLLIMFYPKYLKEFAYLVLFIPSLIFWGSGIMKDSFVLCSTCWISYNFYMLLSEEKYCSTRCLFYSILW